MYSHIVLPDKTELRAMFEAFEKDKNGYFDPQVRCFIENYSLHYEWYRQSRCKY